MFSVIAMLSNGDLQITWWSGLMHAITMLQAYRNDEREYAYWAVLLDNNGEPFDAFFREELRLTDSQKAFRKHCAQTMRTLHLDSK